jgi:hypothetical protein
VNENLPELLVKSAVMLTVVAVEYWTANGQVPLFPRLWHYLARLCYELAYTFGYAGLRFEQRYYEAVV